METRMTIYNLHQYFSRSTAVKNYDCDAKLLEI